MVGGANLVFDVDANRNVASVAARVIEWRGRGINRRASTGGALTAEGSEEVHRPNEEA